MKLIMVRHTSVDVPQGVCYGFSDVPLKASFCAEAATVKENLAGKTFDKVFSSPLSRCTLLAKYCGFEFPILETRIRELNFGDWEMKSWMEIDNPAAKDWLNDWLNYPAKNGESYAMMQKRVNSFMDELKSFNLKSACLFTHAGVIRLIHSYLKIFSIDKTFEFPVEYGQIFEFNI
ncbi:MAG: alpha-ribazole phosphatase [Dysgonamonadaceae bacterium]|jgi:alpha-ribazole phosphatase|nr:alpha-ribazole phosphatase [Dysgonamonadaceae bacterium]